MLVPWPLRSRFLQFNGSAFQADFVVTPVFSLVKPVVVHLTGAIGLTHPPLWRNEKYFGAKTNFVCQHWPS
jgi:hypothetical protein